MEYSRIAVSQADALWELQKAYKAEIEEDIPGEQDPAERGNGRKPDPVLRSLGRNDINGLLLGHDRIFHLQLCCKRRI